MELEKDINEIIIEELEKEIKEALLDTKNKFKIGKYERNLYLMKRVFLNRKSNASVLKESIALRLPELEQELYSVGIDLKFINLEFAVTGDTFVVYFEIIHRFCRIEYQDIDV